MAGCSSCLASMPPDDGPNTRMVMAAASAVNKRRGLVRMLTSARCKLKRLVRGCKLTCTTSRTFLAEVKRFGERY
jgi:hypothetical protein